MAVVVTLTLSTRYVTGDVFDVLQTLEAGSVDLVMTSPPFLALRSYLPADHRDKGREIGSEASPADFLDTLLSVAEECRRVLAPHGSLVVELGDTYSGSGGAGGDYGEKGLRDGQPKFRQVGSREHRTERAGTAADGGPRVVSVNSGDGWPLAKSLCGIPTLFAWSLAYGRNLLRPERPTEPWRIRNVIAWCRPNPPVGALGDKMRPATSYLTVATVARNRWFDMDAVRTAPGPEGGSATPGQRKITGSRADDGLPHYTNNHPAGAPLLDYWEISTQPYAGAHYATFPEELPRRVILSMCPDRVCTACGEPSRRITQPLAPGDGTGFTIDRSHPRSRPSTATPEQKAGGNVTLGWTDCGHDAWRTGVVLDPFAGSGTTLRMALGNGRSSIGIDLDERNAELARNRIGPMFLEVESSQHMPAVPAS